ncbi:unnamed protein product [Peniophora sp. CBMAI 1063]|nr:unnamed protein product [Peniophora sp. CBMAI 1063]
MPPRKKRAGARGPAKKQRISSPSSTDVVAPSSPPPDGSEVAQVSHDDDLRLSELSESDSGSDLGGFIVPDPVESGDEGRSQSKDEGGEEEEEEEGFVDVEAGEGDEESEDGSEGNDEGVSEPEGAERAKSGAIEEDDEDYEHVQVDALASSGPSADSRQRASSSGAMKDWRTAESLTTPTTDSVSEAAPGAHTGAGSRGTADVAATPDPSIPANSASTQVRTTMDPPTHAPAHVLQTAVPTTSGTGTANAHASGSSNAPRSVPSEALASASSGKPIDAASGSSFTPAGHPPEESDTSSVLQECIAVTSEGGEGKLVLTTDLSRALPSDEAGRQRILKIIEDPGKHEGALNLASQPIDTLVYNPTRGVRQVTTTKNRSRAALLFMAGIITHNGLQRREGDSEKNFAKQVCLAPFKDNFARVLATCRRVLGKKYIFMGSYRTGVSFSSGRHNTSRTDRTPAFNPVLARNAEVPVFDARTKSLKWKTCLVKLDRLQESDVIVGMPCIVLFTLGRYSLTSRKPGINPNTVKDALSLNLQGVIVLHDTDPAISADAVGSFQLDYTGIQRDPSLSAAQAIQQQPLQVLLTPGEVQASEMDDNADDSDVSL